VDGISLGPIFTVLGDRTPEGSQASETAEGTAPVGEQGSTAEGTGPVGEQGSPLVPQALFFVLALVALLAAGLGRR
jgi:hypothetical protein